MVGFPLLLIPLAVYNIIVFLMPGVSFADPLIKLTLMSGAEWQVTLSDILLALGMVLLLLEVIKGARPGAKYLTDHLLSLIVFGAAAAEFLLWPKFGNSTYCLLTLLALVDFLSGIALRTRRRAACVAAAPAASKRARKAEPPAAEFEPVPRPAPAASAPAPSPVPRQPQSLNPCCSIIPSRSSRRPAVPSPGLQPGGQPAARTRRSADILQMICRVRRATPRRSRGLAP